MVLLYANAITNVLVLSGKSTTPEYHIKVLARKAATVLLASVVSFPGPVGLDPGIGTSGPTVMT